MKILKEDYWEDRLGIIPTEYQRKILNAWDNHVQFCDYDRDGDKFIISTTSDDMEFDSLEDMIDSMKYDIDQWLKNDEQFEDPSGWDSSYRAFKEPAEGNNMKILKEDLKNFKAESLKEDLENVEVTDNTVVIPQPTGAAVEDSKKYQKRFEDATEVPEDAPLFGAKDQPVPDEPVEPKITLEESLFNEGISQSKWEEVYNIFEAIIDLYLGEKDGETRIAKEVDRIYDLHRGEDAWDEAYRKWAQYLDEDEYEEFIEDEDEFDESIDKPIKGSSLNEEVNEYMTLDELIDIIKGVYENGFSTEEVVDDIFSTIDDPEVRFEVAYNLSQNLDNAINYPIDESVSDQDLDKIKKAFNNYKSDAVIDGVFKMDPNNVNADKLAKDLANKIDDAMDESLNEDANDTLEDYLYIIKRYYKGRPSSEVIDSIFGLMPEDKAFDCARSMAEYLEGFIDESLKEGKLRENASNIDNVKALFNGYIDEKDIDRIFNESLNEECGEEAEEPESELEESKRCIKSHNCSNKKLTEKLKRWEVEMFLSKVYQLMDDAEDLDDDEYDARANELCDISGIDRASLDEVVWGPPFMDEEDIIDILRESMNKAGVRGGINLKESFETWNDVYELVFNKIVDDHFPDEEGIEAEIASAYEPHKGEPAWDEAYRRWTETYDDECEDGECEDDEIFESAKQEDNWSKIYSQLAESYSVHPVHEFDLRVFADKDDDFSKAKRIAEAFNVRYKVEKSNKTTADGKLQMTLVIPEEMIG